MRNLEDNWITNVEVRNWRIGKLGIDLGYLRIRSIQNENQSGFIFALASGS
jgi:hypothetical protein